MLKNKDDKDENDADINDEENDAQEDDDEEDWMMMMMMKKMINMTIMMIPAVF